MRRPSYLFFCLIGLASTAGSETPPAPKNPIAAREAMDCCWPENGPSPQRVSLKIISQGARIRDVLFETEGGASNSVARCIREVAFSFPWPNGTPTSLEITPPVARPSGWAYLAQIAMLNKDSASDRGVLDPAPLVRACLEHGRFRPGLRFRVQTRPVRVESFLEVSPASRPHERLAEQTEVRSESERCAEAVLASTAFPTARNFEFDFSDLGRAPSPAAPNEVAIYFPVENARQFSGTLEAARIQEGLADRRSAISQCWENALARRSELSGARRLEVRLRPTGRVESSQVMRVEEGAEVVDYLFDRCLVHAVEDAKFAPSTGGPARFAYTWIFGHRR